jgi:predicted choloylglycine hydrolase
MVKKIPVKLNINEDLSVTVNRVTVDANDSSNQAIAALKAIFRTPSEKEAQILKSALNHATPLILLGKKTSDGRSVGNKRAGQTKAKIKADKDKKIISIIEDWKKKHYEAPTWKEIVAIYETKYSPEKLSRSRIDQAKKTLPKK